MPGVSVLVKGTKSGTQSNLMEAIPLKQAQIKLLIFSYTGMRTQEVPATHLMPM
jgi:hypothetical protein